MRKLAIFAIIFVVMFAIANTAFAEIDGLVDHYEGSDHTMIDHYVDQPVGIDVSPPMTQYNPDTSAAYIVNPIQSEPTVSSSVAQAQSVPTGAVYNQYYYMYGYPYRYYYGGYPYYYAGYPYSGYYSPYAAYGYYAGYGSAYGGCPYPNSDTFCFSATVASRYVYGSVNYVYSESQGNRASGYNLPPSTTVSYASYANAYAQPNPGPPSTKLSWYGYGA